MSGKGSKPRPYSVSMDVFDQKFDAIFGKKEKVPAPTPAPALEKNDERRPDA